MGLLMFIVFLSSILIALGFVLAEVDERKIQDGK